MSTVTADKLRCYHCGEDCNDGNYKYEEKSFCCAGCRMVFEILNDHGMCTYYQLNKNPGTSILSATRKDKFSYLDNKKTQQQLISFKEGEKTHVCFYLPQIHCSSCLWLLENLHQINNAVIKATVNFPAKQISIVYNENETSLRSIVELLAGIGYEPYISLDDMRHKNPDINKGLTYKMGIAGFCFANIMMLSFPEYLGLQSAEGGLRLWFRSLSLLLSLPVLLYCARPFYISAIKSAAHKFLNIDAPITVAIFVTFIRSAYEILSQTGNGYLDSMSGIVFFMLIGRFLQEKTYRQLSFNRDYTAYFPVAVTLLQQGYETTLELPDIKPDHTLLIHHEELIPADGILTKGRALIDYSFVTGESHPVIKEVGEIIYAGGKQTGSNIELLVIKEVSQSYLTSLWNKEENEDNSTGKVSFVNILSRYFTFFVFAIALVSGLYWMFTDSSKTWNVISAVLIVACPCALLLANTFTNGNVLRIMARNQFYLRNAQVIENIAAIDHIVFDKTGTLTSLKNQRVVFNGAPLDDKAQGAIAALAAQSGHPLAKALALFLPGKPGIKVEEYLEEPGKGIAGTVDGYKISLGSKDFLKVEDPAKDEGAKVYLSINGKVSGYFSIRHSYRSELSGILPWLKNNYTFSVLSGDNDNERDQLELLFGRDAIMLFRQSPHDKKDYINRLQKAGHKVMMIGDGLNDAGALKQSLVGIAVCEENNNFTPASDAILHAQSIGLLPNFTRLCRYNKTIVTGSFIFSLVYNIIGICFAAQGALSPLIAAALMPASSISILLLTFGITNYMAKRLKL